MPIMDVPFWCDHLYISSYTMKAHKNHILQQLQLNEQKEKYKGNQNNYI